MPTKNKELKLAAHRRYRANRTPAKRELELKNKREYYARPEIKKRVRDRQRLKEFGLTPEQWEAKFEEQGRCCAVCQSDNPGSSWDWSTDHCHRTKKVRGILCHPCNLLLGHAKDNLLVLHLAINYLVKYAY